MDKNESPDVIDRLAGDYSADLEKLRNFDFYTLNNEELDVVRTLIYKYGIQCDQEILDDYAEMKKHISRIIGTLLNVISAKLEVLAVDYVLEKSREMSSNKIPKGKIEKIERAPDAEYSGELQQSG